MQPVVFLMEQVPHLLLAPIRKKPIIYREVDAVMRCGMFYRKTILFKGPRNKTKNHGVFS
jgi:hypothetical protein